ncbi:MAG: HAD family phosphatase [Solirubrobacterales bacterium]
MSRIEMVVSDFGGVLTTPLAESFMAIQDSAGISPRDFGQALTSAAEKSGKNPLFELECGRITEHEFTSAMADELEPILGHRPDFQEFGVMFFKALHPNVAMIDLIREVRRNGYRTALLTNNVKEWEPLWRSMLPVDELFETVVDSGFVGCRKPDPRIYEILLTRIDLPPEACVFIDDMEPNCEAAAELGMRVIHYRESAQARAALHELLGLHSGT